MKVTCPQCKRTFPVPDDAAYHKLRCSECGTLFEIQKEIPSSPDDESVDSDDGSVDSSTDTALE